MSELMMSGVIIGLLAIMFYTPALMAMGISKYDGELTMQEKILCCIPVFNIIRAEYKYYGKVKTVTIGTIVLIVGVLARVYIWKNYYQNVTLGTISIIVFWAVIAMWLICNMIFVYTVINDTGAVKGFKLLLYTIAFPFGQYFIGAYLGNIVRHMQQKEDTFKQ